MITKWKVFNFKSVSKETELEFAPLTIFAGSNSSGKSTILQSILLIAQTLENRVSSRSVILNGPLTRLGQFDDIRSDSKTAEQIVIGFECAISKQDETIRVPESIPYNPEVISYGDYDVNIDAVRCELSFDSNPSSPDREIYQLQPRLFGCTLKTQAVEEELGELCANEITLTNVSVSGETNVTKMRRLNISEPDTDRAKLSLNWDVVLDEGSIHEIQGRLQTAEPVGCVLRHFLPTSILFCVSGAARGKARLGCLNQSYKYWLKL
jgi:predicted ATP-dependent endonuclease of OLD family